jgi:hypothetical protein
MSHFVTFQSSATYIFVYTCLFILCRNDKIYICKYINVYALKAISIGECKKVLHESGT